MRQGPGLWLHSFTSCRQVGPWKPDGQPQMYEASKGRHWPPLAHGLEAHGSACWQVFPGGEGARGSGRPPRSLWPGPFPPCRPAWVDLTASSLLLRARRRTRPPPCRQAGDRGSERLHDHPGHTPASRSDPALSALRAHAPKICSLHPSSRQRVPAPLGRRGRGVPSPGGSGQGGGLEPARTRQLQGQKGHGDSSRAWGLQGRPSELFPDQRPRRPQGSPGRSLPAGTPRHVES